MWTDRDPMYWTDIDEDEDECGDAHDESIDYPFLEEFEIDGVEFIGA